MCVCHACSIMRRASAYAHPMISNCSVKATSFFEDSFIFRKNTEGVERASEKVKQETNTKLSLYFTKYHTIKTLLT